MKLFDRLLAFLRIKPGVQPPLFALDEPLHVAMLERAGRDPRPFEQVEEELLAVGLEQLHGSDELKRCWETLSWREQEVTALACLGYTNRQIAARLRISPETVKGYMRQCLIKWNVHGKNELRRLLAQWDFSNWGPPAP